MTAEELQRALVHCHNALGETLIAIGDLLNQRGQPDQIIASVENAQKKYNAIGALLRDISS